MNSPEIICLYVLIVISCVTTISPSLTIGITHFNDISGQIESIQRASALVETPTPCGDRAEAVFNCTGGLRSIAHWLNDSSVYGGIVFPGNIIRISSGNLVGGQSGWISAINGGWAKFGEIVRKHFRLHVLTLGINEFDGGLQATLDFLRNLSPGSVTLANTCFDNETTHAGPKEKEFCVNHQIRERIRVINVVDLETYSEYQVGVIGFVNPLVERLAIPGMLKFSQVVPAIEEVVRSYKDIKSFIAVGDGGESLGKEILERIPQVKLVLYGIAYDGSATVTEKNFLQKYKQGYLATAGKYGSSIGNLVFNVDTNTGNFQLNQSKLVETVRPLIWNSAAQAAQSDYTQMEAQVRRLKASTLGYSRVSLNGGKMCWRQECNLGNLVADAMVHCALNWAASKSFDSPVHSLWHARALYSSQIPAQSRISLFDVRKWLPNRNRVHLVKVSGENVKRLLVAGSSALSSNAGNIGQFLQVSNGLEVFYKLGNTWAIKLTQDYSGIPRLSGIVMNANYFFVVPSFIYQARGVWGFADETGFWSDVVSDNMTKFADTATDTDCLANYIKAMGQLSIGFEGRIWTNSEPGQKTECSESTILTILGSVLVFATLQGSLYIFYLKLFPILRQRFPMGQNGGYPPNQL